MKYIFLILILIIKNAVAEEILIDGKKAYLEEVDDGNGGKTKVLVYGQLQLEEVIEQNPAKKRERKPHREILLKFKEPEYQEVESPVDPIPDPNIPIELQKEYLEEKRIYDIKMEKIRKQENSRTIKNKE